MSQKPRILIVEDDPRFQDIYRRYFQDCAEISIVGNLHAARTILHERQDFCLVILDGRVPCYEGEALRPCDTTVDLAYYISHRYRIPMYAASLDEKLNEQLVLMGAHPTTKTTVAKMVKEFLLSLP